MFCRLSLRRLLPVVVCGLASGQTQAQSADVTLRKHAESGVVTAHYVLSEPTRRLRFADSGELRRLGWRIDGATLEGQGLVLRFPRPVRRFSVQLRPEVADGQFDRTYTPLVPINGGRAAAVYVDPLLPRAGGRVRIAGAGQADGRRTRDGAVAWRANDPPTYVVVGPARWQAHAGFVLTPDDHLPAVIATQLPGRIAAWLAAFGQRFGSQPVRKPWIVAGFETVSDPKRAGFRGDVSGAMIRLNLRGLGPSQAGDDMNADALDHFLAHELFHLWNRGLWQTEGEQPAWLFEGGADAAVHDVLREVSGDTARYARAMSDALTRCGAEQGETLADKASRGGTAPYDCGAAMFHMAAAGGRMAGGPVRPLALWAALFERQRLTHRYAVDDLLAVAGQQAPRQPLAALAAGQLSWQAALRQHGQALGVRALRDDELAQPAHARRLLDDLVMAVVRQDCQGAYSIWRDQQVYRVESQPGCRLIRQSVTLVSIGGIAMRAEPDVALRQARERCAAGQTLSLEAADGTTLALPCHWRPADAGLLAADLP